LNKNQACSQSPEFSPLPAEFLFGFPATFRKNSTSHAISNELKMKTTVLILIIAVFGNIAMAQKLQQPLEDVPMSNKALVLLKDGTTMEGRIENTSSNQHGITSIRLETSDGNKRTFDIGEVEEFLVAMNDAVRFQFANERASSVKKLFSNKQPSETPLDYIVYRNTSVNNNKQVLMQLLNPEFATTFEVFYNPQARKSTSLEGEFITWTGDMHRAFYVSREGGTLINVKKNNYKKTFFELFGDCERLRGLKKPDFNDLDAHILLYEECRSTIQ